MNGDPMQELLDRARRTETRLVKLMEHFDVKSGSVKPVWDDKYGRVMVPSYDCSFSECATVVPGHIAEDVDVYSKDGMCIGTINRRWKHE